MSQYDDLPTSYQVAHITIQPNIILAPMVGVTDSIFRRTILGLGGCGLVSSEMTNASSVSAAAAPNAPAMTPRRVRTSVSETAIGDLPRRSHRAAWPTAAWDEARSGLRAVQSEESTDY